MRKVSILAIGALMSSAGAHAADLPRRAIAPAATPLPVFTWTGFYAGVNAGYAWGRDTVSNTSSDEDLQDSLHGLGAERVKLKSGGFTGGGQLGYNYQLSSGFVAGLEGDVEYVGLRRKRKLDNSFSFAPPGADLTSTGAESYAVRSSTDVLSTVRGRLGYAFDRILVYGTGGVAFGNVANRYSLTSVETTSRGGTVTDVDTGGSLAGHSSQVKTGYVFGGGVEYALPQANFTGNGMTLRAEYLHYDLGRQTLPPQTALNTKVRNEGDLVRAGVNYKFNGL